MQNERRSPDWQRNAHLERWLGEVNDWLQPAERNAQDDLLVAGPHRPQVLVLGAPRSGTTLMMQWLAASGRVAYPTNWMSRFFAAPTIGLRLQQLLTDPALGFRGELDDLDPNPVGFDSALGKTRGALAPNEFWYFWRRFLPTVEIEPLGARASEVDGAGLRAGLRALAAAAGKPFAAKGMMLQYDLPLFAQLLPEAFFVHVVRDGVSNAQSLLQARQSFFGDVRTWYSAKPPEFARLVDKSPQAQVVGQVFHTQAAIRQGLDSVPQGRWLEVPYAAFCHDPGAIHEQLWARLDAMHEAAGCPLDGERPPAYTGPSSFRCTDLSEERQDREAALQDLVQAWRALSTS